MEFLFQFMSEIFSTQEEEYDEMQMIGESQMAESMSQENGFSMEDDLMEQNIFAIGEFH